MHSSTTIHSASHAPAWMYEGNAVRYLRKWWLLLRTISDGTPFFGFRVWTSCRGYRSRVRTENACHCSASRRCAEEQQPIITVADEALVVLYSISFCLSTLPKCGGASQLARSPMYATAILVPSHNKADFRTPCKVQTIT